jgi:hypothetical protein
MLAVVLRSLCGSGRGAVPGSPKSLQRQDQRQQQRQLKSESSLPFHYG